MISEKFVRFLSSSSYSDISEFDFQLAVVLPNLFFAKNKIPSFIVQQIFDSLIYASWYGISRKATDNLMSNLVLLTENGRISVSDLSLNQFRDWLRSSSLMVSSENAVKLSNFIRQKQVK